MSARALAPDATGPSGNPRFSPNRSPSPPSLHRRGYQACDPCRKRKVKCDLGSVDNPRPPPCVRCRRESKRCEFSATRRKRKASEVDENRDGKDDVLKRDMRMMSADTSRIEANSSINNNNHSDNHDATSALVPPAAYPSSNVDTMPLSRRKWSEPSLPSNRIHTSSISHIRGSQPPMPATSYQTHRPSGLSTFPDGRGLAPPHALQSGEHMMNKTAADLLSPAISNTHDALHLLSEAAGRTEDFNRQQMEYRYSGPKSTSSTFTSSNSPMGQASTPGKTSGPTSAVQKGPSMGWYHHDAGTNNADAMMGKATEDVDYANARRAWSRLRFIRAGWFTVDEAMAYIAYYYEHLAPLSPIVLPDFSPPPTHLKLLTEEPVLTVTMLTIASRHMELTGNGANSRAYSIHEKLWSYLRGMIERLFWGQEKFGGGSVPPGRSKAWEFGLTPGQADVNGLRSLGTVEALLLLTDWHPRALYFPPGDDENTLLDADPQLLAQLSSNKEDENDTENPSSRTQSGNAEGRQAFYKWLEPVWRSDRMSWMLLSTAQALAFELGVFDQKGDQRKSADFSPEQVRKRRVRRLILVYISQSSGRLGIPSMLPLPQWNQHTDLVSTDDLTSPMDPNEGRAIDLMHDCWMDISKIMYTSNQVLFLSKEQTSNLIKTGRYRERIEEFLPALREFRRKFDRISLSVHMRHILSIEYEYSRLYINSLALQAVVDKWTTISNDEVARNAAQNGVGKSDAGQSSSGTAPLRVLMEQYQVNEPFIQEVVDASRKILRIVLDGLVPGNYLKHAPVRTYFRVLSGMIFILKTFTLGAREDDVRVSLELQDRTIECLRTCVVDDVHLSVTIADLLQLLTSNIRTRFLRFAPSERPGEATSPEPIPQATSTSQRNSPHPQEQAQEYSNSKWGQNHLPHGSSGFHFDSSTNHTHAPTPVSTQNDPLANIPAQPINSSNLNVSFMPPPASVYYNYYDPSTASLKMDNMDDNSTISPQALSNNAGAGASSNNTLSDWFALPLDQFFNSSVADVDQGLGGTGPMVGEFDMLEVLLKEQHHDDGGGGTGGGGASGGNLSAQFF